MKTVKTQSDEDTTTWFENGSFACANNCQMFGRKRSDGFLYTSEGQSVHHSLWSALRGPVKSGFEVYHLNHNTSDNRLVNVGVRKKKSRGDICRTAHPMKRQIAVSNGIEMWIPSKNAAAKFFRVGVILRWNERLVLRCGVGSLRKFRKGGNALAECSSTTVFGFVEKFWASPKA